jgi:hypothetical protein
MDKKLLPWLITICALGLGGTAAYYSIIGLSKLFAGVATAVIVMASFLEMSKLTLATLLHSYWDKLNTASKIYYIVSLVILSLLTSAGIYGMLSGGYQETANKSNLIDSKVKLLETKKISFEKIKGQYEIEKQSLTENISSLRNALGNNTQSYVDAKGNVISYSSSANRKSFETQLEVAIQKDEQLTSKVQTYNDSIISLETQIVEAQSNTELAAELGPLKYLANLTGVSMDKIINYLLLVIIFVFDPLAIALVIAANFAFAQLKKKDEPEIEYPLEEKVEDMRNVVETYDNLQEEIKEWEETSLTDPQTWEEQKPEEPYQIYTSGSQNDWVIEDEEKAYDNLIASLDKINDINNQNMDFFNKKAKIDAEIARIKEYEESLKEKRQGKKSDENIKTY